MQPLFNKRSLFLLAVISMAVSVSAETYVVSVSGNDSNPGTTESPFSSIGKAVSIADPGDRIYVRGGIYYSTNTITIIKSGDQSNYSYLIAWPGEKPVLDFSGQALGGSNRGILLNASYWQIEGFDIRGAGDNGLKIEAGHYNRIVNCAFYRNRDSGLQMGNGSSHNTVINCDSYFNADPPDYGDADGFAAKLDVGPENSFHGCRAWKNCDDGWDGYLRGADNVSTIIVNCWAFGNGYLEDGTDPGPAANGNGFKMGGSDDKLLRHDYRLTHCLAFKNKSKGFDQNSNKGSMILYNCTGHNNLGDNYKIYQTLATGEILEIKNCIEFGNKIDIADFAIETANSWMNSFVVTQADFVSLDDSQAYGPRQADGSLPVISYMHLAENSDLIDAGVNVGQVFYGPAPDLGCFEKFVAVGIYPDELQKNDISIYPNPAKNRLSISLNGYNGLCCISVYDITGRLVIKPETYDLTGKAEIPFNLDDLNHGIYILNIRFAGDEKTFRFAVDK